MENINNSTLANEFDPNNFMSEAIKELIRCFHKINEDKFDNALPTPIITIQDSKNAKGYCTVNKVWVPVRSKVQKIMETHADDYDYEDNEGNAIAPTGDALAEAIKDDLDSFLATGDVPCYYEINLVPLFFDNGASEILQVLTHEMVHLYNLVNGVNDMTGKAKHNKRFYKKAKEVGLEAEFDSKVGYGYTVATPELKQYFNDEVKVDISKFNMFRYVPPTPPKEKKETKHFTAFVCPGCGMEAKGEDGMLLKCGSCDLDLEEKPKGKRGRKAKEEDDI